MALSCKYPIDLTHCFRYAVRIMTNKLGLIIGVLGIAAAGYCGMLLNKMKVEYAAMEEAMLDLKAELEAAEITAQSNANQGVVEKVVAVTDPGADQDAAEIDRLQALVKQQQAQLAALEAQPDGNGEDSADQREPLRPPEDRTAENMKSFFDRMKEEDPERYAEMKERMAGMKERVTGTLGERINYFTELDVSGLSNEEMDVLAITVEKMNAVNQMMASLDTDGETVDAFSVRQEMFGQMRELGDLMQETRGVLEADLIRGLGYEAEQAQELSAYLGSIREMTSMRSMFRGMMGGRGPGGGPGGGGGAGGGGPDGGGRGAPPAQ